MELSASTNVPRLTLPTLEPKNNFYVVPANGRFHYFPIKISEESETKPILRFEKAPPILIDGMVFYKKKLYAVTSGDILRGIVKKSREIKNRERDDHGSAGTTPAGGIINNDSDTIESSGNDIVYHAAKPRTDTALGLELNEAVDAAWQEQVDSLLGFVSSKEGGEWEIASVAQP